MVPRACQASSCNPEWRPLAWSEEALIAEDELLDGGGQEVEVLLALHALDPAQPRDGWGQQLGDQGRQQQLQQWPGEQQGHGLGGAGAAATDVSWPLLPAAAHRPAFQLPAMESSAAPGSTIQKEADVNGSPEISTAAASTWEAGPGSSHAANGMERQRGGAAEVQQLGAPASPAVEQQAGEDGANSTEVRGDSIQSLQSQQPTQQPRQNGVESAPAHGMHMAEAAPAFGRTALAAIPEPAAVLPGVANAAGAAESAAAAHEEWLVTLAAGLAGTGCCPGRLVAAWQLGSLEELFPAGADLAALRQPLLPNTLVLQFGDGQYLCPPPPPALQVWVRRLCQCARCVQHTFIPSSFAYNTCACACGWACGGGRGLGGGAAAHSCGDCCPGRLNNCTSGAARQQLD